MVTFIMKPQKESYKRNQAFILFDLQYHAVLRSTGIYFPRGIDPKILLRKIEEADLIDQDHGSSGD